MEEREDNSNAATAAAIVANEEEDEEADGNESLSLSSVEASSSSRSRWFAGWLSFLRDAFGIIQDQIRIVVFLSIVAIPIAVLEGWTIVRGLYWMVVTATTIGLGDKCTSIYSLD